MHGILWETTDDPRHGEVAPPFANFQASGQCFPRCLTDYSGFRHDNSLLPEMHTIETACVSQHRKRHTIQRARSVSSHGTATRKHFAVLFNIVIAEPSKLWSGLCKMPSPERFASGALRRFIRSVPELVIILKA